MYGSWSTSNAFKSCRILPQYLFVSIEKIHFLSSIKYWHDYEKTVAYTCVNSFKVFSIPSWKDFLYLSSIHEPLTSGTINIVLIASRVNKCVSNPQFIGLATTQQPIHLHPQCWIRLTISRIRRTFQLADSFFSLFLWSPNCPKKIAETPHSRCHRHSRLFDIYKFPSMVLHVSWTQPQAIDEWSEKKEIKIKRSLRTQCLFCYLKRI